MIKKFRKKPVELFAMQFFYEQECMDYLKEWMGDSFGCCGKARCIDAIGELQVKTLEDGNILKVSHIATEGDWIVQGVKGEFYPIKPEIFEELYEEIV